ncbi:MAG TPA: LacI family transcriptional regulator, partial [Erwinia persicina]|nr:LacI family transcriptional regulator [Erwinia persicina]
WQIGYAALEQVLKRIAGDDQPRHEQVFSGELIVRGSTQKLVP